MIYMLHSVGNTHTQWIYNFLSVRLHHIENLFIYLNRKKIRTCFVKDLYDYDFIVPDNQIALTFDDGYLDNWVYLFPLLKKYEIKATFFVNPEFIDSRDIVRENLIKEVHETEKDKVLGFLSWNEMIEMEKSRLVDIQSHSMSHTWYYTNPELIDFYSPIEDSLINKYPWISWNENPVKKPFTHNTNSYKSHRYGMPVFKHGRSLGIRKFYPDEEIIEDIVEFASNNDGIFNGCNKEILVKKFKELSSGKKEIGRYETDSEMKDRFNYELEESKKILEKKLNKEITILCWPGGAYNEASLRLSEDCGYIASTIWSRDKTPVDNIKKKYKRIPRKPMSGNIAVRGKSYGPSYNKNFLIHENYPAPFFSSTLIKMEKILRLMLNK